ncbi:MAG TPA: cation diffusion facilitator family transporter [bacterium]|nr:cation diffusion facilitator family transporter [bacterium]
MTDPLPSAANDPAGGAMQVKQVKVVTWTGMVINILLSGFKIFCGIIGSSQAIIADGFHSLSDTTTDVAVLVGVNYWTAPPDDSHPHGHRRIETIITMLIGLALAIVAIGIGYKAITTLHEMHASPPGLITLIAALASIISKEALYQWTVLVGKRVKSNAVVANAWHHRSDALSSVPVAAAIAGARFFPGWTFLDHLGAILVSAFILQAAWKIAWPALKELSDSAAPPEICNAIAEISLSTPGVRSVHRVRTRQLGYGLQVDLHVQVEGFLNVKQGHDISMDVKKRLIEKGPNVVDVVTHLEPYDPTAAPPDACRGKRGSDAK